MARFNIYRAGRVHVQRARCATCIFRAGNLMNLEPGRVREMVAECLRKDTAVICHETMDNKPKRNAVCRGFFDAYADNVVVLKLAKIMGVVLETSEGGSTDDKTVAARGGK